MKRIREIHGLTEDQFLSDHRIVASAKYYLIESIQICLEISYHIIGVERWDKPTDYASSFTILAQNNVIPSELAERLVEMTMFRNRLVHIYEDFDDAKVYSIVRSNLDDIDEFAKCISAYIYGTSKDS
ncbi:MAG: DUF86 domain-containing protein [Candidatus Lokiarchaeota archaeon]|nr:DUF86 domain-containing protein [Candidatus Lokiarchaeota archaeon]